MSERELVDDDLLPNWAIALGVDQRDGETCDELRARLRCRMAGIGRAVVLSRHADLLAFLCDGPGADEFPQQVARLRRKERLLRHWQKKLVNC